MPEGIKATIVNERFSVVQVTVHKTGSILDFFLPNFKNIQTTPSYKVMSSVPNYSIFTEHFKATPPPTLLKHLVCRRSYYREKRESTSAATPWKEESWRIREPVVRPFPTGRRGFSRWDVLTRNILPQFLWRNKCNQER